MNTATTTTATTATTGMATAERSVFPPAASWCAAAIGGAAMAGYLLTVLASNIASVHWPPLTVGGLLIPAGTLFAGASLTARDLLHDALGAGGVGAGILVGAGLSGVLASPQIAVASVLAFAASEVVDALVYARLRPCGRLGAVGVSNTAGLVADSVLFVPLAFGSFAAVPGQPVGKTVATILTLAALHATSLARRAGRP